MEDIQDLLRQSAELYVQLDRRLVEFADRSDDFTPEKVEHFQREIVGLEENICTIDAVLMPRLENAEASITELPAYQDRAEAMARVQEHNRLLSQKVRGIMSVISSELAQIRGGKQAVSGYRAGNDRKGSIVRGNY